MSCTHKDAREVRLFHSRNDPVMPLCDNSLFKLEQVTRQGASHILVRERRLSQSAREPSRELNEMSLRVDETAFLATLLGSSHFGQLGKITPFWKSSREKIASVLKWIRADQFKVNPSQSIEFKQTSPIGKRSKDLIRGKVPIPTSGQLLMAMGDLLH